MAWSNSQIYWYDFDDIRKQGNLKILFQKVQQSNQILLKCYFVPALYISVKKGIVITGEKN